MADPGFLEWGLCPYEKNFENLLLKLRILVILSNNPILNANIVFITAKNVEIIPQAVSPVYVTYIYIQKSPDTKKLHGPTGEAATPSASPGSATVRTDHKLR